MSNGVAAPTQVAPAVRSGATAQAQDEAGQARGAREAATAGLARGVTSLARAEAPPPDPVDIAKSAGIGMANGLVNTAGLPADMLTGLGYLSYLKPWTSDELRRWMERYTGGFYQPESRDGRYAETIGEMSSLILPGGLLTGLGRGAGDPRGTARRQGSAGRREEGRANVRDVTTASAPNFGDGRCRTWRHGPGTGGCVTR